MAGTMLATLGIESLGIGVDQWFGSVADPSSPIVSGVLLPIFVAIAAADFGLVALYVCSTRTAVQSSAAQGYRSAL